MKRLSLAILVATVVSAATAACVVSRLYWGHWFAPPSAHDSVVVLESLDRFTTTDWSGSKSGAGSLAEAASSVNYLAGEFPLGRLPAALLRRGLKPATTDDVPQWIPPAVGAALEERGVIVEGRPGYPDAKKLRGHLALGRDARGTTIVVAALAGGAISNDHYPYYEVVFAVSGDRRLELRRVRRYFYDVAGLEGIAHWLAAAAVCLAGGLAWIVSGLAWIVSGRRR